MPLKWPHCVMPKNYLLLVCTSGNDGCLDLSPLHTLFLKQGGLWIYSSFIQTTMFITTDRTVFHYFVQILIDTCIGFASTAPYCYEFHNSSYLLYQKVFHIFYFVWYCISPLHRETRITVASYSTFPLYIFHKIRNI